MILLSESQAEDSWKILIHGSRAHVAAPADVFVDEGSVHLRSGDVNAFSFSVFPDADEQPVSTAPLQRTGSDGEFTHYVASVKSRPVALRVEKVREAAPSSPVRMGKSLDWRSGPVATAPDDSDFEKAEVRRLTMPRDALDDLSDAFLDMEAMSLVYMRASNCWTTISSTGPHGKWVSSVICLTL